MQNLNCIIYAQLIWFVRFKPNTVYFVFAFKQIKTLRIHDLPREKIAKKCYIGLVT